MQLWQLDVTDSVFLADGAQLKLISGLDDCSRFCVIATVVRRATARAVCRAFVAAMRLYGIPDEVLTDTGRYSPAGSASRARPAQGLRLRLTNQDRAEPVASATRGQLAWASVTTDWTAPAVERADPDHIAAERRALEQRLDYQRDTLLTKCAGLTARQLTRRAVPPSNLSLLGLVRHIADEERGWFRQCAAGEDVPDLYWTEADNDAGFNDIEAAGAEADLDTYRREIVAARTAVAGKDLDDVVPFRWGGPDRDIRWIYLHMIEEYARHNGHADLIRECIDGVTGE